MMALMWNALGYQVIKWFNRNVLYVNHFPQIFLEENIRPLLCQEGKQSSPVDYEDLGAEL